MRIYEFLLQDIFVPKIKLYSGALLIQRRRAGLGKPFRNNKYHFEYLGFEKNKKGRQE